MLLHTGNYRDGFAPGYWGDEQSDLPASVEAFYAHIVDKSPEPKPQQLSRIQEYLEYYINAPCWDQNPYTEDDCNAELQALRERVKTLASVESIRRWISEAVDIGIDPM